MIGEKRIRDIVSARPLTRNEAGDIVRKYNSVARDLNRTLKEGMKAQGYDVGFDEYGAFLVGRKGLTLPQMSHTVVNRKRKAND